MVARVHSYLLSGIDALPCEVEVDSDPNALDRETIVGLPDAAVKESLERVRAAILNAGYPFPRGKVLINLAPADVRKEGPVYDLPIAVGLLIASGVIPPAAPSGWHRSPSGGSSPAPNSQPDEGLNLADFLLAGELALDGRVRPVRGIIALAALAKQKNLRGVIVPRANASEAAVVTGVEAHPVSTLPQLVGLLTGQLSPEPHPPVDVDTLLESTRAPIDFAEVKGQESVKRALMIAAAGGHNILMLGPPGTGKTMMARALPGILPPMTPADALDVTRIYSAAGRLERDTGLITARPVRTPHHTASASAIVGGGVIPKPGEISLAHHGILFLDELPEFPRPVLETLRQPLEDHVVTIARAHSTLNFPASFMLVAAMNPTPKGDMATDQVSKAAMERYLAKVSGPLIDRIDIHVEAPAVPWNELAQAPRGTDTVTMRTAVAQARRAQHNRQGHTPNARLTGKQLDTHAPMTDDARTLLGQALTELGLSARAYDKIRRVARTISDLDAGPVLALEHVSEAVQYRLLDRNV